MKSILFTMCLMSTPAWAILANYGGELPDFPPHYSGEPRPHLEESIEFQTSFVLDWKTFGRRELAKLDLGNLILRSAEPHRLMMAYKVEGTREGTVINIVAQGRAQSLRYFFDTLLTHNIISMVYLKTGIFSSSSEEYRRHWRDTHTAIKREIETKALIQWGAKQKDLSASELCSKLMEVQEVQSPSRAAITLNNSGDHRPAGVRLRKEMPVDHEIEAGSLSGRDK